MKQFAIYTHADGRTEAVKRGFSWPGFFFTWLWAALKGLYGRAAILFIVMMISTAFGRSGESISPEGAEITSTIDLAISLAICLVIGFQGNGWRETRLLKKGFRLSTVTEAPNDRVALGN